MENCDIIIIGAGAAGLMAASASAGEGRNVIVLEKMHRPGRKLMITGKGRCNFTNLKPWNDFCRHIHPKSDFLKPAFYNLSSEKTIGFLSRYGLESTTERGDRVFPVSHLASDVVDTLVSAAESAGARILCGKTVKEISSAANDGRTEFTISCEDSSSYKCNRLIICTGGLSYPKTGSTGDGYRFAKAFGHEIRQTFPSLTAIVPAVYKSGAAPGTEKGHIDRNTPLSETGKALCGNHLKNIQLTIIIDGNQAQSEFGDMDFTDGGIEGPVGFKVSRKCVKALINGSRITASIDLKPAVGQEELEGRISALWNEVAKDRRNGSRPYKERFRILLTKVLPMSLIAGFTRLNPDIDHRTLAKALKNWKFEIAGYVGYERSVVTAGGIACEEVVSKTMESRLMPGIYFAGEILDLDADTGGYNIQTAFSTGWLAGINAAKSIR